MALDSQSLFCKAFCAPYTFSLANTPQPNLPALALVRNQGLPFSEEASSARPICAHCKPRRAASAWLPFPCVRTRPAVSTAEHCLLRRSAISTTTPFSSSAISTTIPDTRGCGVLLPGTTRQACAYGVIDCLAVFYAFGATVLVVGNSGHCRRYKTFG